MFAQYYSYSKSADEIINLDANEGLPTRYIALGRTTSYAYDGLNRLTGKTTQGGTANIVTSYTYKNVEKTENYTTTQLASEDINGVKYTYEYDKVGNIIGIYIGDNVSYRTYEYDSLGQLTIEIRHDEGVKVKNEYNHLGNIRFRKVYDWTPTSETLVLQYTYNYSFDSDAGWNYLLTSIVTQDYINNVTTTETVDYDAIGNPTTYRGATLAFNGRQLTSYNDGTNAITYKYDASGLRASKTVNGNTTIYQYVGDKLYFEQRPDGSKLYFFYDSYGNLTHLYHHVGGAMTAYNVLTNSQGDVIAIYNWNGNQLVASYSYDAWGNLVSVTDANGNEITSQNHIAFLNPIRYRGYYYDSEIGLYYLQSRYYDPNTGRFINSDAITDPGAGMLSNNTFIYCANNPVGFSDSNGYFLDKIGQKLYEGFAKAVKRGEEVIEFIDEEIVTPIKEEIVEPAVEYTKEKISSVDLTFSTGRHVSVTKDNVCYDVQCDLAFDTKGGFDVLLTLSGSRSSSKYGVSGGVVRTVTTAPSVDNLTGPGCFVGGSGGFPTTCASMGGNVLIIPDYKKKRIYQGISISGDVSTSPGAEVHGGVSYTISLLELVGLKK